MEPEKKLKKFLPTPTCPIRGLLSRLGDRWSMLVLVSLQANSVLRFGELQRTIGDISPRMLTCTLRSLEADGLVERTVYAEVPPRVEYRLTAKAARLMPLLEALVQWAVTA